MIKRRNIFLSSGNIMPLIGIMELYNKRLGCVIIIVLITSSSTVNTSANIFIFSWDVHTDQLSIPKSDYFEIHYDPIEEKGIMANYYFDNNFLNSQYTIFETDTEIQLHFGKQTILNFRRYIDSVYYPPTSSIFLMSAQYTDQGNFQSLGLDELRLTTDEFITNSIAYPSLMPMGSGLLALGSNYAVNQLLVLVSIYDGIRYRSMSLIYDFSQNQWLPTKGEVPIYLDEFGQLSIGAERNEAIYFHSLDSYFKGANETNIFDFNSMTWVLTTSPIIPSAMTNYDIIYHAGIKQYILLGGIKFPGGKPNDDVWLFDPVTFIWTKIYQDLPILSTVMRPKFYYSTHDAKVVGFGPSRDVAEEFVLFSLNIEGNSNGISIDFGDLPAILLTFMGITLGFAIFIFLIFYRLRRKIV